MLLPHLARISNLSSPLLFLQSTGMPARIRSRLQMGRLTDNCSMHQLMHKARRNSSTTATATSADEGLRLRSQKLSHSQQQATAHLLSLQTCSFFSSP